MVIQNGGLTMKKIALVFAVFAYPIGMLADRLGLKHIFIAGLGLFALVYFGMAVGGSLTFMLVLFFLYGLYAAATDGIAKAWITEVADPKDTATAIGTFAGFQSICALLASSLAGVLWFAFGPAATFIVAATAALAVMIYLTAVLHQHANTADSE